MEQNDYLKLQFKNLWRAVYALILFLLLSIVFNIIQFKEIDKTRSLLLDGYNKTNVRLYNDSVRLSDDYNNINNLYNNVKPLLRRQSVNDDVKLFNTPVSINQPRDTVIN